MQHPLPARDGVFADSLLPTGIKETAVHPVDAPGGRSLG